MKRYRGFKLGRKIVKVFEWIIRPRRKPARYHIRLGDSAPGNCNAMSKLLSLGRQLRRGARKLGFSRSNPPIIQQPGRTKPAEVPKGHLAVYVGESDDETKRVLVPVIYFNHPLFGELLKEAEQAYGFNHAGGITIPCRISEFEKVKMKIAAWDHRRRRHHRLHW